MIARTTGLALAFLLSGCTAWCLPSSLELAPSAELQGQVLAPAPWVEPSLVGGQDLPVAGAELLWVDAQGQALPGGERVLSDGEGRFRLRPPLGLQAGWVVARGVDAGGRSWRLIALAVAGAQGLVVDWSSTLAAARWQGLGGAQAMPAPQAALWAQAWAAAHRGQAEAAVPAPNIPPVAAPNQAQALPPDPAGVAPPPPVVPEATPPPPAEVLDAFAPIYGGPRR